MSEYVGISAFCAGILCGDAVEHLVADPVRGFVEVCGGCLEARDLGEDCIADVRGFDHEHGIADVLVLDSRRWAAAVAINNGEVAS